LFINHHPPSKKGKVNSPNRETLASQSIINLFAFIFFFLASIFIDMPYQYRYMIDVCLLFSNYPLKLGKLSLYAEKDSEEKLPVRHSICTKYYPIA